MEFELKFTDQTDQDLNLLEKSFHLKRLKAVRKALGYLQSHPSLNTHKYDSLKGLRGEDIFEAYAENNTLGAYRIFWHYGPSKNMITIISIVPHP